MIHFQTEVVNKDFLEELYHIANMNHKEVGGEEDLILDQDYYVNLHNNLQLEIITGRDSDTIVGFLVVVFNNDQGSVAIENGFYVLPEYRSKSIGSELLRFAEELCHQEGVESFIVGVPKISNLLKESGYSLEKYLYKKVIN